MDAKKKKQKNRPFKFSYSGYKNFCIDVWVFVQLFWFFYFKNSPEFVEKRY